MIEQLGQKVTEALSDMDSPALTSLPVEVTSVISWAATTS
jgi:hypothetical protein